MLPEHESAATRLAAELASATVAVAVAAALALAAERWLHLAQPGLVLVTAVVFVGVRARRRVSVYAAVGWDGVREPARAVMALTSGRC